LAVPRPAQSFTYRVSGYGVTSRAFRVDVRPRPRVARIDLRYEFPSFSGLAPRIDEDTGDVYAPVGTKVKVIVHTTVPVAGGDLGLTSGPTVALAPTPGRTLEAQFRVARDDSYRLGLVDEIGLPDQSVTKITFLEVIEHVHERQALEVLRCFHRILKPGGRAVISTPNYASLWPMIEWLMDALKLAPHMADDQHVAFYTARSLAALGAKAGLKLIAHRTVNFAAPWIAMLNWKAAEAVHRLETARSQPLGSLLLMTFEPLASSAVTFENVPSSPKTSPPGSNTLPAIARDGTS
jgi:SAM-dependent methyltransferase